MKKKLLLFASFALFFMACASAPLPEQCKWVNFTVPQFEYMKIQDEKTRATLLAAYDSNAAVVDSGYFQLVYGGPRNKCVPPPGMLADYGYLLMQKAETKEKGRALIQKEMELYPASRTLMLRALGESP
jgi:hypothetical protein